MDLPPSFANVNGKAACWKIGDGGGGGDRISTREFYAHKNKG